MTRKFLSLISGLMIMFLSLNSLYAFKVEKGTFMNTYIETNGASITIYPAKTKEFNKNTALFYSILIPVDGKYALAVQPYENYGKIKDFNMFIGNAQGEQQVTIRVEYNEGSYFMHGLTDEHLRLLVDYNNYLFIRINKKWYSLSIDKYYTGKFKETADARIEAEKKRKEEEVYKNSDEYKQKQRKDIIEKELKNYRTEKDKFENKTIIMSSKYNTDNDNVSIANANIIYIKQLLEMGNEYYAFSGGFFILQKAEMNNAVTMLLRAIDFSDGDKSVRIRFGNYGLGDVGAYKYAGGNAYVANTVRVGDESLIELYNLLENSGNKKIYLRVYSNTESYDTTLNNACKNQMLDLLRLFRKTTKSWNEVWSE